MGARRRLLDDISRMATGTAGLVQGAGREAETLFRVRLERLLDQMELVPREEFEVVKAMAVAAREENEALAERVARLEAAIQSATKAASARKSPARRPAKRASGTAGATSTKAEKAPKTAN